VHQRRNRAPAGGREERVEDRGGRDQREQHAERWPGPRDGGEDRRVADVAQDHERPLFDAIGHDAGERPQEAGEGAREQEHPDRGAGALGLLHQEHQCDQGDAVADVRDRPREPQPAERS